MPLSRLGMNVVWEALEKGHKILEEAHVALVNAFFPSLEDGHFKSEQEWMEEDEEDVKEDDER